ncbi:hypothetical protein LCGC14_1444400 [marine sediment metagenome]|uniref:Acylneuraminate cytidylyltransferase n=1 Tax=marine sediment metagenome TaxID=412755 RepID=A0A0F9K5Z1_9ZZZZ
MKFKVMAIIQARVGSLRLPRKVLKHLEGQTVLARVVNRVSQAKTLDKVVVATTKNRNDNAIVSICWVNGWWCYRGSEEDVLDRYYNVASAFGADVIVRITSDCPLIDPGLIDDAVNKFISLGDMDYVSNLLPRTYPRGLDVEVIGMKVLEDEWRNTTENRQHVTLNIRQNPKMYNISNIASKVDCSGARWTLDTREDLEFIRKIYKHFKDSEFTWMDVVQLLTDNPKWILKDTAPILEG